MEDPGVETRLRERLERLKAEHRALDNDIAHMTEAANSDEMSLRRMKKRKLFLKDEISRLSDALYPDIIA